MNKQKTILVVTCNSYAVEKLQALAPSSIKVIGCYRDYNLDQQISSNKPDAILTDGTIKTRDVHGQSVSIYFSREVHSTAKKYGIPVKSLRLQILKLQVLGFLQKTFVPA